MAALSSGKVEELKKKPVRLTKKRDDEEDESVLRPWIKDNFSWFLIQTENPLVDFEAKVDSLAYVQIFAVYWTISDIRTILDAFTKIIKEEIAKNHELNRIFSMEANLSIFQSMLEFLDTSDS